MKANSDELQSFVSVVDSGSISAAAEQMGLTASAVSRTLSRLEHKLGTTLLNRTTRRMELTEEGRYFLDQARQILQQMEALEERLALRRQSPAGRLRINAASPFMLHAVVPHIGEFRRLYPDIQLELNTNDLIIDLLEQRTDVAIRIGALSDSTLQRGRWAPAACTSSPARSTWPATARRRASRGCEGTPCSASPSPSISTAGRWCTPTAIAWRSSRISLPPAARRSANWP